MKALEIGEANTVQRTVDYVNHAVGSQLARDSNIELSAIFRIPTHGIRHLLCDEYLCSYVESGRLVSREWHGLQSKLAPPPPLDASPG